MENKGTDFSEEWIKINVQLINESLDFGKY